jgi:hypothetical protein
MSMQKRVSISANPLILLNISIENVNVSLTGYFASYCFNY